VTKNRSAAILAGGLLLASSGSAMAQDAVDMTVEVDARKASARASSATIKALEGLKNRALVCLDLQVTADGSQRGAILTASEGDVRRYPVDCRKGQLGSFPMAEGVEYYLPVVGKIGKTEVDIEVYPGMRTTHPFNDVRCVAASDGDAAVFHISGFYTVMSHDFGERRVFEFRPATGKGVTREAAQACLE